MKQFYKELLMPEGKYSLKRYIATKFAFIFVAYQITVYVPILSAAYKESVAVAIIGVITAATAATIQITKKISNDGNNNSTSKNTHK